MQYQYDSKMQHKLQKFSSKFLWSGFIIIVFSFSSKGLTCLLDLDFSFINLIRPLSIPWYSWCSGILIYLPSLRHVGDVGHVQNGEYNTELKGYTMAFSLKITHSMATFLTKYSNVGGLKSDNFHHMRMVRNNESLEKFFK